MPWHVNDEDKALVIEFGYADLIIASAGMEGGPTNELVIWPAEEAHPLGALYPNAIGKTTRELKALVRLVFHDPQSLDVFIHQAQELRKEMGDTPKWVPEEE